MGLGLLSGLIFTFPPPGAVPDTLGALLVTGAAFGPTALGPAGGLGPSGALGKALGRLLVLLVTLVGPFGFGFEAAEMVVFLTPCWGWAGRAFCALLDAVVAASLTPCCGKAGRAFCAPLAAPSLTPCWGKAGSAFCFLGAVEAVSLAPCCGYAGSAFCFFGAAVVAAEEEDGLAAVLFMAVVPPEAAVAEIALSP